jgi:hypothetical protein
VLTGGTRTRAAREHGRPAHRHCSSALPESDCFSIAMKLSDVRYYIWHQAQGLSGISALMQVPLLPGNYNRRTRGQEEQGHTYMNQSSSYITIIILLSDRSTRHSETFNAPDAHLPRHSCSHKTVTGLCNLPSGPSSLSYILTEDARRAQSSKLKKKNEKLGCRPQLNDRP